MEERSLEMIALVYALCILLFVWFGSKTLGFFKGLACGAVVVFVTGVAVGVQRFRWQERHAQRRQRRETNNVNTINQASAHDSTTEYCDGTTLPIYPGQVYLPPDLDPTDMRNGGSLRWEPLHCKIKHHSIKSARECLIQSNKTMLFFGDSLMYGLTLGLHFGAGMSKQLVNKSHYNFNMYVPGEEENLNPIRFSWLNTVTKGDPSNEETDPGRAKWIREADIIFLHHGLWDIGKYSEGVLNFYQGLKKRVAKIKAGMKPGARLVIYELHKILRDNCMEYYDECYRCNPDDKVAAYREALQTVAACQDVYTYSTYDVGDRLRAQSLDGNHFDGAVHSVEKDILLNHLCGWDNVSDAIPFTKRTVCNEEENIKKWASTPDALIGRECMKVSWYDRGFMAGTTKPLVKSNTHPRELDTAYLRDFHEING